MMETGMGSSGAIISALPVEAIEGREDAPPRKHWWMARLILLGVFISIAGAATYFGLVLRKEAFIRTDGLHFFGDVANGYGWGRNATAAGVFSLYDKVVAGQPFSSLSRLDYTPLRLGVVTYWYQWTRPRYPDATDWQDSYEFTRPMLQFNAAAELISSVLIFLLIRMWVVRQDNVTRPPGAPIRPFRGVVAGMIGALLFWFNPAVVWDGHCWPQWDVWLVPWFLGALLLACMDWWFVAGVCLMIGASLKGQLLMAAPIMVLWPLFQLRIGAVLRLIAGGLFAFAAIAFPFMRLTEPAFTWFMLSLGAMILMVPIMLRWQFRWYWLAGSAVAAALLAWPWTSDAPIALRFLPLALLGLAALARFLPPTLLPATLGLIIALAAFLNIPLFSASKAWYTQGFEFGTTLYPRMHGTGTHNLPAIMTRYFRYPSTLNFKVEWPLAGEMPIKNALGITYGICLTLAAIGAAIQDKRRDTRFLIAMFAPWLLFFLLLPQMHGRYSVWAAAMGALLVGAGTGMTLLGIIVTLVSWIGILENQWAILRQFATPNNETYAALYPKLTALNPHLAWLLLLIAAISLFYALALRSRSPAIST